VFTESKRARGHIPETILERVPGQEGDGHFVEVLVLRLKFFFGRSPAMTQGFLGQRKERRVGKVKGHTILPSSHGPKFLAVVREIDGPKVFKGLWRKGRTGQDDVGRIGAQVQDPPRGDTHHRPNG
jgi:hypothetical protein